MNPDGIQQTCGLFGHLGPGIAFRQCTHTVSGHKSGQFISELSLNIGMTP